MMKEEWMEKSWDMEGEGKAMETNTGECPEYQSQTQ